jgi:hypothetical protein
VSPAISIPSSYTTFSSTVPALHKRDGLVDNIVIDHLAALLEAGVNAKAWSLDDAHFTAVFLFSGLHAVVDDAYINEKRVNRARLSHRAQQLCSRVAASTESGTPPAARD